MSKDKSYTEELAKNIKKKKYRKYGLILLAAVIMVSSIVGLKVENKDSLLPDGQGNVVTNEQTIDDANSSDDKKDGTVDNQESSTTDKDSPNTTVENSSTTVDKNQSDASEKNPSGNTSTEENPSDNASTEEKPSSNTSAEEKPSAEDLAVDNSNDPTASNDGNSAYKPEEAEQISVTISVRCNTLSEDMSKLTNDSIADYIPSNGIILKTTTYKGTTDNTVFDALNTVCRNNGIQLESTYTPLYESYYVEGINYLYEFDAGVGSGWMYKVNGWFPNYGCSSYYLNDGDIIEWVYTCDYGTDVGGKLY